jgi:hypothetical protein
VRKFIAIVTDKEGALKIQTPIYADDATSLEHVTSAYEERRGHKLGHMNRFGGILKEVVEVTCLDTIIICDSNEPT